MYGQGYKNTLYYQFTIIDWLLNYIQDAQIDFKEYRKQYRNYKEYAYLKAAACVSQGKYKEYYNIADNSATYYAAQVLLLYKKWQQFHQRFNYNKNKKHQLTNNPKNPINRGVQGLIEELQLEEYKDKYSTPITTTLPTPISFIYSKTFSGLKNHKQIKFVLYSKSDAY